MPQRQGLTVAMLGTAQTLAWASSYYLPAMIAAPMARGVGVSTPTVFAAFSAALIVSALLGPRAGKAIDTWGGRPVLVASSLVFATGLTVLALAAEPIGMFAGWLILGVGMGSGLYEAAFSALVRLHGAAARPAITGITLIAGFASTVGWPLTSLLEAQFGWRATCLCWAGVHLALGLPLNWSLPKVSAAVPGSAPVPGSAAAPVAATVSVTGAAPGTAAAPDTSQEPSSADPPASPGTGEESSARIDSGHRVARAPNADGTADAPQRAGLTTVLLAYVFAATWFISTAMAAHLPRMLEMTGITLGAAVAAGALVGPAQVAARVLEFGLLRNVHPLYSAILASLAHPLGAAALLLAGAPASVFTLLHGAGNGILTIAKGTLPLFLFGPLGYGHRQGLLSVPARMAQAIAPFVFGLCLDRWGAGALWLSTFIGLSAFAALLLIPRTGSASR